MELTPVSTCSLAVLSASAIIVKATMQAWGLKYMRSRCVNLCSVHIVSVIMASIAHLHLSGWMPLKSHRRKSVRTVNTVLKNWSRSSHLKISSLELIQFLNEYSFCKMRFYWQCSIIGLWKEKDPKIRMKVDYWQRYVLWIMIWIMIKNIFYDRGVDCVVFK